MTFKCEPLQCDGITPRTCIGRQVANEYGGDLLRKRYVHGVHDLRDRNYPECFNCPQGKAVLAAHPGVEKEVRARKRKKKVGQIILRKNYKYTRPYVPRYFGETGRSNQVA